MTDELISDVTFGAQVITLITAAFNLHWSGRGLVNVLRGRVLPVDYYRCGVAVLMIAILNFRATDFLQISPRAPDPWIMGNHIALAGGVSILAFGWWVGVKKDFDRLWALYPHLNRLHELKKLIERDPAAASILIDVAASQNKALEKDD